MWTMAPVLVNPFMCLMMECWHDSVKRVPGVGVNLKHRCDNKLFRWCTTNAIVRKLTVCLFGDDGTVRAVSELQSVRRDFGQFPYFVSTIAASGGMNGTFSEADNTGIERVWSTEKSCLPGQEPETRNKEQDIPSMCPLCTTVWLCPTLRRYVR